MVGHALRCQEQNRLHKDKVVLLLPKFEPLLSRTRQRVIAFWMRRADFSSLCPAIELLPQTLLIGKLTTHEHV